MIRTALRHSRRSRYLRPNLLHYSTSSKPNAEFFITNAAHKPDPKTGSEPVFRDENHKLRDFITSRKQFYNPSVSFVPSPTRNVEEIILENTFEPTLTWDEITTNNRTLAPVAGSIIEFYDFETDESALAVVLQESQSKFNENHNKLIVLTSKNELKRVYAQDINFAAFQVFDAEWLSTLGILYHRFMEDYPQRLQMVDILRSFIQTTVSFQPLVQSELRKCYARTAAQENANSTSLLAIVKQIDTGDLKSYFHQSALLMAIHLEMCRDVSRWMVSSCLPRQTTNLASLHCSNDVPPETVYFANSINNHETIIDFLAFSEEKLHELGTCIENLIASPKDYDELNLYFTIWEGKPFLNAFRTMMFALVYPHPKIMTKINEARPTRQNVTRLADLEDLLHRIGILNNPKNPLTDVLLSSNICGRPSLDQLAAASPRELKPSTAELLSARMLPSGQLNDKFPHLRRRKYFTQEHTIYMLPYEDGHSNIGISSEKINARKFLINIHVPDVVARLPPASAWFEEVSKHSFSLSGLKGLLNKGQIGPLAKNVKDLLSLKAQDRNSNPNEQKTCMTVTYEYHTLALSPMKEIDEGVSISFDDISDVKIKEVPIMMLEDGITGRSRVTAPFKLFQRFKKPEPKEAEPALDEADLQNLGFLFGALKTHFSTRNMKCASSVPPGMIPKSISRSMKYEKEGDREVIHTNFSITPPEEAKTPNALQFARETKILLGSLVSVFCQREGIPAFSETDDVLDPSEDQAVPDEGEGEKDEVLVSHQNFLLPNYYCSSYYQAILAKDGNGFLSLPAFFIGNNYLGKPMLTTTTSGPSSLKFGLPKSRVKVSDATVSLEAYLNQLQILSYIHLRDTRNNRYLDRVKGTSHLKALGYPVHGALADKVLRNQLSEFQDSKMGSRYLSERHNRYWKLKYLEQRYHGENKEYLSLTCIITSLGHDIDLDKRLVRGWCVELGMEVDLLAHYYNDLMIGSTVTGNEIMYLSAVEGICVLQYREAF